MEAFKEAMHDLPAGSVVFVETSVDKLQNVSVDAIKHLVDDDFRGIVLLANRPYQNQKRILEKKDIRIDRLYMLDCVSKGGGMPVEDEVTGGNVIYLDDLSDLMHISVALLEYFEKVEGRKFFIIDSITTMLMYNEPRVFTRFLHMILTKMRMRGVYGVMVFAEGESTRPVRAEIAQLCDEVIKL